jgi:hypothetical protein
MADAAGGGGDSEHRVFIDVRGAAPGMRTGIESGSGPATVNLRTTYAIVYAVLGKGDVMTEEILFVASVWPIVAALWTAALLFTKG